MLHRFVIHARRLVVALWLASQRTLVSSEALAEHSGLTNRYFSLHNRQLKKTNKPTPPLRVRLRWATYVGTTGTQFFGFKTKEYTKRL